MTADLLLFPIEKTNGIVVEDAVTATGNGHSVSDEPARKGLVMELAVARKLLELGCDVFFPLTQSEADLVCITPDGKKLAIQVKTAHRYDRGPKGIHFHGRMFSPHGRREYTGIDYFIYGYHGMFWIVAPRDATAVALFETGLHREAWHLIYAGVARS